MQNSKSSYFNFKKIPNRYAAIVLPLLLSIIMTFIVSCISTFRSIGFENFSLCTWLFSLGDFLADCLSSITFYLTDCAQNHHEPGSADLVE